MSTKIEEDNLSIKNQGISSATFEHQQNTGHKINFYQTKGITNIIYL